MERAKSISVEELKEAAAAAARSVLGDKPDRFGNPTVGFIPDIGTVGLIWDQPDLANINAGELFEISAKMTQEMAAVARGARPTAAIVKGGVIAGYFPVDPIIALDTF